MLAGCVVLRLKGWQVSYGHAERTLAAIRLLEAETAALLAGLPSLNDEQSDWLEQTMAASVRGAPGSADPGRGPKAASRELRS
jgi:hypothetical protein